MFPTVFLFIVLKSDTNMIFSLFRFFGLSIHRQIGRAINTDEEKLLLQRKKVRHSIRTI